MFTLSVAMIVKNEQQTLARALACAATFADEIVVVDTGSTDNTKRIALSFTPKVFDFDWCDDFSAARNFSFSKATCNYVMWLDADDVVPPKEAKKIVALKNGSLQQASPPTKKQPAQENFNAEKTTKENSHFRKSPTKENTSAPENDVDVYMCRYCTGFDSQNQPALTYYRERIVKNHRFLWQGFVHEVIVPSGKISYTNITIEHRKIAPSNPKRNLQIYQRHKKNGAKFSAREQYYYSRELFYNGYYKSAIKGFKNFLARPTAEKYPPDEIGAFIMLADCHSALLQPQKAVDVLCLLHKNHTPTPESACKLAYAYEQMSKQQNLNQQQNLNLLTNSNKQSNVNKLENAHKKMSNTANVTKLENSYEKASNLQNAIFWFKAAMCCPTQQGGFVCPDYACFLPCLELSRLLYPTDYAAAKKYHQQACKIRPTHPSVLFNQKFFQKR